MELTNDEKQAILNQRVKQFAAEKFNHEINKTLLEAQKVDATKEAEAEIDVEIAKTDEAIAIIDNALTVASEMRNEVVATIEAETPVEAPAEAEVVAEAK